MTEREIQERIELLKEGMRMLEVLERGLKCRWILALHTAAIRWRMELDRERRKA